MNFEASPHLIPIFDFDILHMELNTVLYTVVLVLVVMFFLNRWLFQPVLRTLENRANLMQSLQSTAHADREEIAHLSAKYREDLSRVLEEVARVRAESHKEISAAVNGILGQAREGAQQEFERAVRDLQQQMNQATARLGETAQALAEQTTNHILGA